MRFIESRMIGGGEPEGYRAVPFEGRHLSNGRRQSAAGPQAAARELSEVHLIDDKGGKPVGIQPHIGCVADVF
jgi:hypothetical protein